MRRWYQPYSRVVLGLVLSGLAFGAASAIAEPTSDRAIAEQILADLGRTEGAEAAAAPVKEAKRSLERAAGTRAAGDVRHAEQLEGLAREWAETARDLLRAIATEADAGVQQLSAADAAQKAERARALLEEAIARRGRAEAELAGLADAGTPVAPLANRKAAPKPATPAHKVQPAQASTKPGKDDR